MALAPFSMYYLIRTALAEIAAKPVIENKPAPIMAPIPKVTRLNDVRVFLRVCEPSSDSLTNCAIDFLRKRSDMLRV